jgi:hypothetical protein
VNTQRAERGVQIFSIVSIWLVFLAVWSWTGRHSQSWKKQGTDLPDLTLLWLDVAGSAFSLAIPLLCTVLVLWLLRARSAHSNWVAGAVLCLGVLYALAGHTAIILPTFTLCGAV